MLHPRFVQTLGGYLRVLHKANTDEILDKCLYHDQRVYLPQFPAMEERMSMAVSLESRVPLLDHRVVELIGRIPPTLQVNGRQPKRLLKEIVRPLLPEGIRERRDKRPFPVPMWEWFDGELAGTVRDILRSPQCLDRGVFHPDRLHDDVMSSDVVWPLINLELWFRIFVDRDPHWVEQAETLITSRLVHSGGTPVRARPAH